MSEDPAAIGWYFAKVGTPAGQEVGPFSREQLVSLAQAGTLMPGDLVCNPRQPRWFPAAQVPGLFAQGAAGGLAGAQARGRMFAWLLPLVAVILVGAGYGLYFGLTRDGVASPFTSTVPSGFQFDDSTALVVEVDAEPLPRVDALTPIEGPVGTKIKISGSGLASGGLTNVMLGEEELALRSVADELLEAWVPCGARSGDIKLAFAGGEVSAGAFTVLEEERELLLQQELSPSSQPQTASVHNIAVTIPGGVLESAQTVTIERIPEPQRINLPESGQLAAFSVAVGEMHEFADILTITFDMPPDAVGKSSAFYLDENTTLWESLPSEVVDNKLRVYTNHLTEVAAYHLTRSYGAQVETRSHTIPKSVYSQPGGFFEIRYYEDDLTNFKASMDELAISVGKTLEEAKGFYDEATGKYRETFKVPGSFGLLDDSLDVYLDSRHDCPKYGEILNNIELQTNYLDQSEFEHDLAHELFHVYQDAAWSEVYGKYLSMRKGNDWAIEALAELAAYEVAFADKKRTAPIAQSVDPEQPYDTLNDAHEYSMACYLSYLLTQGNTSFGEMWEQLCSGYSGSIEDALNDFFSKHGLGSASIPDLYGAFWRDAVGNAEAAKWPDVAKYFAKRRSSPTPDKHSVLLRDARGLVGTTTMHLFGPVGFGASQTMRIFVLENTSGSKKGPWVAALSGIDSHLGLADARVPGGYRWTPYMSLPPDTSSVFPSYGIYRFREGAGDVLVVALEIDADEEVALVKLTEVQARSLPERLDDAAVGEEYNFGFAFKDIPGCIKSTEIVIDFGDGQVARYKQQNTTSEGQPTGALYGMVKHAFSTPGDTTVKCSLYDGFESDERLIAQVMVPVAVTGEVATTTSVTALPETTAPVTAPPVTSRPDSNVRFDLSGLWDGSFYYTAGTKYLNAPCNIEMVINHAGSTGSVETRILLEPYTFPLGQALEKDAVPWGERIRGFGDLALNGNTVAIVTTVRMAISDDYVETWTGTVAVGEDGRLEMSGTYVTEDGLVEGNWTVKNVSQQL